MGGKIWQMSENSNTLVKKLIWNINFYIWHTVIRGIANNDGKERSEENPERWHYIASKAKSSELKNINMEPESKPSLSELSSTAALGDYVMISEVGEGSFSRVWKAVHRESGEVVALKQIFLSRLNRHLKNCLDCEIRFLSSVCHPNIVRLLKAFQVLDHPPFLQFLRLIFILWFF